MELREPVANDRGSKRWERRRGPDLWLRMIRWLGIISWSLMLPLMFLIDRAKPEFETVFDRMFDLQVRSSWDAEVFRLAVYLMVVLFFLSATGFMISRKRARRKEDSMRVHLLILMGLSVWGIFYYLFLF